MEKNKVKKTVIYTLVIILCYVLQGTPNLIPRIHDELPVLLIPLALAISSYENCRIALVIGAICGVLTDLAIGRALGPVGIVCAVSCFCISVLFSRLIKTNVLTVTAVSAAAVALILSFEFLINYRLANYGNWTAFYTEHYVPRMVYTWAVTPLFYTIKYLVKSD